MSIGPRDKPYPLVTFIDSVTGKPVKIAEASAIYVSSVSAITLSATNYYNLPTSSLSSLNDIYLPSIPLDGQSLVWSSTKWIASSIDTFVGAPGPEPLLRALGVNSKGELEEIPFTFFNKTTSSVTVSSDNNVGTTLDSDIIFTKQILQRDGDSSIKLVPGDYAITILPDPNSANGKVGIKGDIIVEGNLLAYDYLYAPHVSASIISATTYYNLPSAMGPQGYQGAQGYQGRQGYQGLAGTNGAQGAQGYQGNQGFQGYQGAQGFQGYQGRQGDQGLAGTNGAQGAQGAQGYQGYQGAQGFQGYQGAQGFQGYQGRQGDQGLAGTNGAQGAQGYQGRQGEIGRAHV